MGTTASTVSSPVHSSVYLLKDLPVKFRKPNLIVPIEAAILSVSGDSLPGGESAKTLVTLISEFMRELKERNAPFMYWSVILEPNPVLNAILFPAVVERLCSILDMPFLQIFFKFTLPYLRSSTQTSEKKLDLKAILQEPSFQPCQRCFFFSPEWINSEVVCDILLGWTNPPETDAVMIMNPNSINFLDMESSKDMILVAGNGAEIKCHRIILEARSEVFARMLSPAGSMMEARTDRIDMSETSEQALTHFIRYLYGLQLNSKDITCDMAVELFKLSHKYKLPELQGFLEKLFLRKGSDWFTSNDLMELYFHVRNLDECKSLQNYLLRMILGLRQEVRTCERFRELEETDRKAAIDLVWKLVDLK